MAIIFQTQFADPLDTDFPESAPHGTNYREVAGRGINGGQALTCTNGPVTRRIATYGGANYATLTARLQWGLALVGTFPDAIDGMATRPGMEMLEMGDPISASTGDTSAFQAQLKARPAGKLTLYINGGGALDSGRLAADSAAGVLTYDGQMYGVQVTFAFAGPSAVTYNVVVNNVSVISGSFTPPGVGDAFACPPTGIPLWAWITGCLERAAITQFSVQGYHNPSQWETSIPEVVIDDAVAVLGYGPSNALAATVVAPCAGVTPPAGSPHTPIRRLRRAPHLSAEQVEQFFARFQLDLEAGVGTAVDPGTDPQVWLRWSDDGGHTWRAPIAVSAGTQGAYRRRALWRRLGRSRDRVFEVSMSDPVKWALLAAAIDAGKGSS